MGVSKNRGTPKWMVKIMENPIKMDDLGGNPLFSVQHPYKYTSPMDPMGNVEWNPDGPQRENT